MFRRPGAAGRLRPPPLGEANPVGQSALLGEQAGVNALPDVGARFGERLQQAAGAAAFADLERSRGVSRARLLLI